MRMDIIPNPAGLCALTADGRLGIYDEKKRFHLDTHLTKLLQEYNAPLLQQYLKNGNWDHARLALIHPTRTPREWGTVTLWLEDTTMRRLYLSGDIEAPLTSFQKRNQEKSIYRGMELLLEYRDKEAVTIPRFCPVLFDCRRMLDQYLHCLGRPEEDGDRAKPVIEVINLFAGLLPSQRQASELRALSAHIHASLIRKDQRREVAFTLFAGGSPPPRVLNTLNRPEAQPRLESAVGVSIDDLHKLHLTDRVERIERWLQFPYHQIDPDQLRSLHHFHKLDKVRLELLASKSLIYTAPAVMRLLKRGMNDRWNLYLLEGKLQLRAEDGQTLVVEGGTPKAAHPIGFLKPRKYSVITLTRVRFLWIHDAALPAVMAAQWPARVPIRSQAPMKLEGLFV